MGRCSLTVALPILSATGVETIGLPTAVLSNHTAFAKWTYHDLTEDMLPSVEMWKNYDHHFDCIYTGYLGNGQSEIVSAIIRQLKEENTMVVVDPAFGDGGRLYAGFDGHHVNEIRQLLTYADVTCPNVTEACALAQKEYHGETLSEDEIESICNILSRYGPGKVVLTGLITKTGEVGCVVYDAQKKEYSSYFTENLPGRYHGAGDSFASAMVGLMLNDISLLDSVRISHDFIHRSMNECIRQKKDGLMYGLPFEQELPFLYQNIQKMKRGKLD